jgi:hypothetical protein
MGRMTPGLRDGVAINLYKIPAIDFLLQIFNYICNIFRSLVGLSFSLCERKTSPRFPALFA